MAEVCEPTGQSIPPLVMIEAVLKQAGVERNQIECLAVGLGPGSYTGIRGAIALAQGWQLASSVKLLGVSSAECLAAQAQAEKIFGRVGVVIDAQRNELYLASYEISETACREVAALRLTTPTEAQSGETMVGPEVSRWFAGVREIFPSAAALGGLASGRSDFISGEQLEPIYLRATNFIKAPPSRNAAIL